MTETKIQIDIEDSLFLDAAKIAHEKGITFNQFVEMALEEMIERENSVGDDNNQEIIANVQQATAEIIRDGVTTKTLTNFGYAFSRWNDECTEGIYASDMIQSGFDIADEASIDPNNI